MIRIAFYINTSGIHSVDLNSMFDRNPGIGGTEYMFLLISCLLQNRDNGIDVKIYANKHIKLDNNQVEVVLMDELSQTLKHDECDFVVLRGSDYRKFRTVGLETKIITWSHNYLSGLEAYLIAKDKCVVHNVFVSRQQYDFYIDNDIINKSSFIFNVVADKEDKNIYTKRYISYIGSLSPQKSVELLTKAWPKVIKRFPDLRLKIAGSGKLYDRSNKLGEYGIAESKYETKILKPLIKNNLMSTVEFVGVIAENKNQFIGESILGIVNPSAFDETFCISAVDYQWRGVPVIAREKNGLCDTVSEEAGFRFKRKRQLAKAIIKALESGTIDAKGNYAKIEVYKKFSIEPNIISWESLINKIYLCEKIEYIKPDDHFCNNNKWLRIVNRKIRRTLHLPNIFSLLTLHSVWGVTKRKIREFIRKK